jgi:multidrug efflux pump subunit AcrA (membrane-fusion protein)
VPSPRPARRQQRGTPGPPPPRRRSPEAAAAAQLQRTLADVHNDRHPKYVDIVVKGTKEDSEERRAAAAAAHLQAQLVRLEQERAAAQELADALLQSQQALMQEKQRVQQENSALQREQAALRERLDYLQELHCGDGGGGHAPAGSPGGDGFYSPRHFGVDGHGGELPITPDSTVLRQIQQQLEGEEDGGPGGGRPPLEDGPPLEDVVARLQLED